VQINLNATPTPQNVAEMFECCLKENVELTAIGCYGNPLHPFARTPDGVTAEDVLALLEYLPPRSPTLSPLPIVIWSGSLSGQMDVPHPGNRSPHAVTELTNWTRGVTPLLEQKHARLVFKPAHAHVLGDPNLMDDFLEVHSKAAVGVVMDPCSFIAPKNFDKREALINDTTELLASRIALVHLRDARIEKFNIAICGPGQGQLGFAGLIKLFKRYCPGAPWMIDGVESELQLRRSREFVQLQARLAGIEI
jgi:sugar phosphate isomerase/epimerase